jgi:hypothetical protein
MHYQGHQGATQHARRGTWARKGEECVAHTLAWQTNSLLPDERPAVVVVRPPPAFAAPVEQPGAVAPVLPSQILQLFFVLLKRKSF